MLLRPRGCAERLRLNPGGASQPFSCVGCAVGAGRAPAAAPGLMAALWQRARQTQLTPRWERFFGELLWANFCTRKFLMPPGPGPGRSGAVWCRSRIAAPSPARSASPRVQLQGENLGIPLCGRSRRSEPPPHLKDPPPITAGGARGICRRLTQLCLLPSLELQLSDHHRQG